MSNHSQQNVGARERWVSLIGGGLLAGFGIARRSWAGAGLAVVGGALVWRGATRKCAVKRAFENKGPVRIQRTFTVPAKDPGEVYRFWRNLENLPKAIGMLQSVTPIDERRSHWVAKGPVGVPVSWDAEIVNDRPGCLIEWRSLPGSTVDISGIVRFKRKQQGQGTKVHLEFSYVTPGGAAGETLASLLGQNLEQKVESGMRDVQEVLTAS